MTSYEVFPSEIMATDDALLDSVALVSYKSIANCSMEQIEIRNEAKHGGFGSKDVHRHSFNNGAVYEVSIKESIVRW